MHPLDQHEQHEEVEKQIQFQQTEAATPSKTSRPSISPSISQRYISTTPKVVSSRRSQTLNNSAVKEALNTLQELENQEKAATKSPDLSPIVPQKSQEQSEPTPSTPPQGNTTPKLSARNIIQRIQSIQGNNNGNSNKDQKASPLQQSDSDLRKDNRVRFGEVTTVEDSYSNRSSSDFSTSSQSEYSSFYGSNSNFSNSEFFYSPSKTSSESQRNGNSSTNKYHIVSDDEESDSHDSNSSSMASTPTHGSSSSLDTAEIVTGKTIASKKAIRLQDAMAVGKTRKRLSRSMHTLTWFLGEIDFDKFMLHKAAREGDLQKIKQHIEPLSGEDLKFFLDLQNNTNLWTPLHVAIESGKSDAARLLIEVGASIELKDKIERTPLLYACRYGNLEICKLLLEKGADLNAFDCYGETALHLACANPCENSIPIIDVLLSAGLDVNCKNTFRETCLHKAARAGNQRLVEYLLKKGAVIVTALQGKPKDVVPAENHELFNLLEEAEKRELEVKRASLRATKSQSGSGSSQNIKSALPVSAPEIIRPPVERQPNSNSASPLPTPGTSPLIVSPLTQQASTSSSSDSEIEDEEPLSEEEIMRKPSWDGELLDTPAFTDFLKDYKTVIQPLDNSDIRVIEPSESPLEFEIDTLYEPYREDFFRTRHFIFACREIFPDEPTDIKKTSCIFIVKRFSATGIYKALAITKWGFTALDVHQKDLDNLIPASPGRERENKALDTNGEIFRVWLEKACHSSFFQTMVTPPLDFRTSRIRASSISDLNTSGERSAEKRRGTVTGSLMMSTRKGGPKFGWYQITEKSINVDVLGLEAELAPSRCYCIAVVYAKAGQTSEQEMYRNECSTAFEKFLDILGDKIEIRGWSGFRGGFDTTSGNGVTFYTSWRGFEIMYHVVPFLHQDQVRRLVGNDKAIIYFQEETAFVPNFRSDVNSIGVVVQPCTSGGNTGYLVGAFTRPNVKTFHPSLPSAPITNRKKLKDLLISTAISGIEATNKSPPFVFLYANRWKEALDGLLNKYPKSKSKLKKKS